MKINKFVLPVLLVSATSFAQDSSINNADTPVMTTEVAEDSTRHNPRKSHWLTSFGFEGMKYELPFEFDGAKSDFKPNDQELWGGRIGLGGEVYLGKGFLTTTKLEGYFVGTLFSRVLNGGNEDEDVKFAYTKRRGQVFGADLSQSIGYIFDMKTKNPFLDEWTYLTVEPYIEAGIGMAKAYNRLDYSYKLASTNERYKHTVNDDLTNAKIGVGVNFTSTTGYFFYMKATQNRYDITQRKMNVYARENNGTITDPGTQKQKDAKIDPVTVYAIGGGYKF